VPSIAKRSAQVRQSRCVSFRTQCSFVLILPPGIFLQGGFVVFRIKYFLRVCHPKAIKAMVTRPLGIVGNGCAFHCEKECSGQAINQSVSSRMQCSFVLILPPGIFLRGGFVVFRIKYFLRVCHPKAIKAKVTRPLGTVGNGCAFHYVKECSGQAINQCVQKGGMADLCSYCHPTFLVRVVFYGVV